MFILIGSLVGAAILLCLTVWVVNLRRVVSTNEVHIVQSSKKTTSYGKDTEAGNTYYEWPSWIPIIGIQVIKLPVSNFSLRLDGYDAYDKGRVPFILDLEAFFQISDSNIAAQRVSNIADLNNQLRSILQGAARTILASKDIEEIMQGRAEFGEAFTKEVAEQLKNWGVTTVKNIELMDIRDSKESKVIANIMEKKKSHIEMQSRVEVAENIKTAQTAELEAKRQVEIKAQEVDQAVGIRTAEKDKAVGIAKEQSIQEVKVQSKITAEKDMAVEQVKHVRAAEIAKDVQVVKAEEKKQTDVINAEASKQTDVIRAEGEKTKTVLVAEGQLEAKKREAEGIQVEGEAKGKAETAILMAPVNSQITLAKEIGSNEGYQHYLISIRNVEATEKVGIEQAQALKSADIKVIANSGNASSGLSSVGEVLSSKGGTQVGAMLEGLANTDAGKSLLSKFGLKLDAPIESQPALLTENIKNKK